MAKQIIDARVRQKVGTEAEWLANDLTLLDGEAAVVRTGDGTPVNLKFGDGNKKFSELPYWIDFNNSQRIPAVNPGALPTPTEENVYMVVTGVGAYTYGGSTIGTNADGYQTTFWWTGSAWVNNGSVRVKGDDGVNSLDLYNSSKVYKMNEVVRDEYYNEYISIIEPNIGNPLTDGARWKPKTANSKSMADFTVLDASGNNIQNFTTQTLAREEINRRVVLRNGIKAVYKLNDVIVREVYTGNDSSGAGSPSNWSSVSFYEMPNTGHYSLLNTSNNGGLASFLTREEARNSIPNILRIQNMTFSYISDGKVYTDRFIGAFRGAWSTQSNFIDSYRSNIFNGYLFEGNKQNLDRIIAEVTTNYPSEIGLSYFNINTSTKVVNLRFVDFNSDGTWKSNLTPANTVINLSAVPTGANYKTTISISGGYSISLTFNVNAIIATIGGGSTTPTADINFYKNVITPKREDLLKVATTNSGNLNIGKVYPMVWNGDPLSLNTTLYGRYTQVVNSIIDLRIEGDYDANYIYSLDLIAKGHATWGNGLSITKRNASDYSIVERVNMMNPTSNHPQAEELDKLSKNSRQIMTITSFGLTFQFTIDPTQITSQLLYISYETSDWMVGQYFSKDVFLNGDEKSAGVTQYDTLMRAAMNEAKGLIQVGNTQFMRVRENELINIGVNETFETSKLEDFYAKVGGAAPNITMYNPVIDRLEEEGKVCEVLDMTDEYVYYAPGDSNRSNPTQMADRRNFFYRRRLDDPAKKTKFILTGLWAEMPEDVSNFNIVKVTSVIECNDGGILVGLKYRSGTTNLHCYYKVPYVNDTATEHTYTTALFGWKTHDAIQILNKAWGWSSKGKYHLAVPYGGRGYAVLSKDYGNTWEYVFSMADTSINTQVTPEQMKFVSTKPDGSGGFGAIGGHPMKDTLTNPQSFDLWGITANGNLHSHGGCIDEYVDRIIIVTGDGSPALGVFYSDDWGYNWTFVSCGGVQPATNYSTQFVNVISMPDHILLGCDGQGDGYFRLPRIGKNKLSDKIDATYQFGGYNSLLVWIAGCNYRMKNGIVLGTFAADGVDDQATVKGGVVATIDGHNFKKVVEDEFFIEDEYFEYDWRALISSDDKFIYVKAGKGGFIKYQYRTH